MATIKDWKADLHNKTSRELMEINNTLLTLKTWSMFEKEYPEMQTLRGIVSNIAIEKMRKEALESELRIKAGKE